MEPSILPVPSPVIEVEVTSGDYVFNGSATEIEGPVFASRIKRMTVNAPFQEWDPYVAH